MKKLKAALASLTAALGIDKALLAKARRRTKANNKRQLAAEAQSKAAAEEADKLRKRAAKAKDPARKAELTAQFHRKDDKAMKFSKVAARNEHRALAWKARVRRQIQKVEKLTVEIDKVDAELAKLGPIWKTENQLEGGTPHERWRMAALTAVKHCSDGTRRNEYSMSGGGFDVQHEMKPGPASGSRSDCSMTQTGFCFTAGLDDINGEDFKAGFTGTMVRAGGKWKQCTRGEMEARGWGIIVYGEGDGHHTEGYCPSEDNNQRTVGHGSPPVDFGVIDLFGPDEYQRYFIYA